MNEADPLRAPKRERLVREDEARGDGAALGLVVALGLCVLGAIFYVHRHPLGEGVDGAALMSANGEPMGSAEAAEGMNPQNGSFMGTRKEMKEMPLENAKPIARDVFAPPVTHVTENDACKSLRLAKERIRDNMRQAHSEVDSADLQRDLNVVMSQGTERGCWTGGAG
jgi:hypothetical protein